MTPTRTLLTLVAATCATALCTHSAEAQTSFRLLDGSAAASLQFWNNPNQAGPLLWSDFDTATLAPPPVMLGSAAGTARVEFAYGPFGPNFASVVPWAEASLAFNSPACGQLDISMAASLNLGIADLNGTQYNVQPDVAWLVANQVGSFSGSLGAGTDFLIEAFVDDCDICLPADIFEVDLEGTPDGSWEPWSGCLPGGTHLLQLAGGGLSEAWEFSWDRDTQTLILPSAADLTWSIHIPAPSSACLIAFGGLLSSRRRR